MPSAEALRASEVLLASALDVESEASLVSDAHRQTIYCNRAFTVMTGYGIEQLFGGNCAILQGPMTDRNTIVDMRRALDAGWAYRGRLLNYRRDGTTFWNELTISPVHDSRGDLVNFVSVQRDVSDEMDR
ncbi:MAG: PAS domain-containing protein [Acidobacteria bacterium]|nr:PAS domain-containing protein [Acidobacteriota bacterium]